MSLQAFEQATRRTLGPWKRTYSGVNHLVVGLGNWYYPLSRESVGLQALNRFAQRYSLSWDFIPTICCDALASKTGVAFLKPKTYQQRDMGKAVEMATEAMNLTADEITIVHYDDHVPCGQTRYRTSGLSSPNVAVQSVLDVFRTERLNRVAIGVMSSNDNVFVPTHAQAGDRRYLKNYEEIWLRNVLIDEERILVDKASDRLIEELVKSTNAGNTFSRLHSL